MSTAPKPRSRMGRQTSSASKRPSVVISPPAASRGGSGWDWYTGPFGYSCTRLGTMSDPTGRAGSSPPAIPITMTWSKGPAASVFWVASWARPGPMPLTSDATSHAPAVPVWEKTGSSAAGFRSKDFTIALSSGLMGASTAARLVVVVTSPSSRIVRYRVLPVTGEESHAQRRTGRPGLLRGGEQPRPRSAPFLLLGRRRLPQHPDGAGGGHRSHHGRHQHVLRYVRLPRLRGAPPRERRHDRAHRAHRHLHHQGHDRALTRHGRLPRRGREDHRLAGL